MMHLSSIKNGAKLLQVPGMFKSGGSRNGSLFPLDSGDGVLLQFKGIWFQLVVHWALHTRLIHSTANMFQPITYRAIFRIYNFHYVESLKIFEYPVLSINRILLFSQDYAFISKLSSGSYYFLSINTLGILWNTSWKYLNLCLWFKFWSLHASKELDI